MESETHGAVTTISTEEKESLFFLTSDIHFDSVDCARKAFFDDMDRAVSQGAKIIIPGDFFDAMNGRFDPRRSMDKVRTEYQGEDYYDRIVNDAITKLEKYAKNILIIADGNHELAVLKNSNTHLIDRLIFGLNRLKDVKIIHGGYGGWIRIMHKGKNMDRFDGTVLMKYFHGAGGEAPVTRGAIQTARQAVIFPDADVVLNGHSHNAYWIPITRERISGKGVHYFDTQHHVRTPGYSQAYGDGTSGWEVTRGGVPKPLGSIYMRTFDRTGHDATQKIEFQPVIHNPEPVNHVADMYNGINFPQE
jgi:hypothetical protein